MTPDVRKGLSVQNAAIMGIYEVVSTIVDYQFNASSSAAFAARDAMAGFHGKVFFFAQLVSLAVQLFVTSPVHRRFGVLAGLVILPIALLTGTVAFLIVPTLWVITLTIGGEASFAYSINQASKEILYVPLGAVEKYKGKAFIDMFVFRAGKTVGAGIILAYTLWLQHQGIGPRWLMAFAFIAIFGWLIALWSVRSHPTYRRIREE